MYFLQTKKEEGEYPTVRTGNQIDWYLSASRIMISAANAVTRQRPSAFRLRVNWYQSNLGIDTIRRACIGLISVVRRCDVVTRSFNN